MIQRSNTTLDETYRSLCWDEENRLMSVTDFEDGGNFSTASAYVYNAGGERVWKYAGQIERMSLNGDLYVDVAQMTSRTLYANPYLVATDQHYTKHYFIETERIASKPCTERSRSVGGGFGIVENPMNQGFAIAPLEGSLEDHSDNLHQHIINSFSCSAVVELGAEIELHGIESFADLDDAEEELYFSHSDHLGSASFITNASGEAVQHLQYLPYGEHFVSQTSSSWESRYTFSGKEKDQETGYSYFGARYYNSDLSVWLSVDPMSDKYPNQSAYSYVGWRPINVIDPNGMWEQDADGNWVAAEGDSWWSFHEKTGMSWKETMAYAKEYNAARGQENWKFVGEGDKVTLPGGGVTSDLSSGENTRKSTNDSFDKSLLYPSAGTTESVSAIGVIIDLSLDIAEVGLQELGMSEKAAEITTQAASIALMVITKKPRAGKKLANGNKLTASRGTPAKYDFDKRTLYNSEMPYSYPGGGKPPWWFWPAAVGGAAYEIYDSWPSNNSTVQPQDNTRVVTPSLQPLKR